MTRRCVRREEMGDEHDETTRRRGRGRRTRGATAAQLARGRSVLLLDRAGRIKPCGGAIPPRLIERLRHPDASAGGAGRRSARMVSPTDARGRHADRQRLRRHGRPRACSTNGCASAPPPPAPAARPAPSRHRRATPTASAVVHYRAKGNGRRPRRCARARCVIGADGALRRWRAQAIPAPRRVPSCSPTTRSSARRAAATAGGYDGTRCDIYLSGRALARFLRLGFPARRHASVGTGSADKGFSLRGAVGALRKPPGSTARETMRREGAPIPLKPLKRWDNGRDVVLAGDAAGVVAPASGEGIYYAMAGGRLAADAVDAFLATGDARALALARKRFMREHGRVFWMLGIMQRFWYTQRPAARALRHHLPRSRRAAAHLGGLHEQGAGAREADGACAHLLQGSRASVRAGLAMSARRAYGCRCSPRLRRRSWSPASAPR